MNKAKSLKRCEKYFGKPLFDNYLIGTDEEIIEMIDEGIKRDKAHTVILLEKYDENTDLWESTAYR